MNTDEKILLMITVDVPEQIDDAFNDWYDTVHVPEIVGCPGFISGRRFVALDPTQSPRYTSLYEVEHADVLNSPEVQAVRGWGPFEDQVSNYRRLWFRRIGPIVTHDEAADGDGHDDIETTPLLGESPWPIPSPRFALEPETTALIIVDMQEAQCRTDRGLGRAVHETPGMGEYFFSRLDTVIPNQSRLLDWFRAENGRIVFLTVGPHSADGSDLTPWRRRRNKDLEALHTGVHYAGAPDPEHGVIAELQPRQNEIVLNKPTFGAFASTGLDHLLRNWGVKSLVVCGLATNVCVYMTAAEAADRGYECVVVEDACAAWEESLHNAFLRNFELLFGRVGSTTDTLRELGGEADTKEAAETAAIGADA